MLDFDILLGITKQARKALRCLKGLVKIQALLRGYLVRKQASATLHSMQALMRAQATVLAQKSPPSIINHPQNSNVSQVILLYYI